ncbi:MAG: HAMP domain-containing histidine kinase [Deferribacterales bacterium]
MIISQVGKLIKDRFFFIVITLISLYIITMFLIYGKLTIEAIVLVNIIFVIFITLLVITRTILMNQDKEIIDLKNRYESLKNEFQEQLIELQVSNIELKTLNLELVKAKTKLEDISNYRGRFLNNMSHELRTPLNTIVGFSHVLLESDFSITEDEKITLLKSIYNSGKRLLNIINNILDLNSFQQNIYEPTPKYIDITPTLEAIVSTARGLLKDKTSIILNTKINGKNPLVYADEKALNKVLLNIINNACKFTSKGEISISTKEDDKNFYIIVSDTGIGMTEDELERVFEPFTKMIMADQPIELSEGVGIGMTISKYLMEKMEGDIIIKSKKDYGTTVEIVLKKEGTDG